METKSAPLRIEYFTNANAGKGTEREGLGTRLAQLLTQTRFTALVHATATFEELDAATEGVRLRRPDVIMVDGGDGTLNVVFSRILRAYEGVAERDLPFFIYIPTGTMRLVGTSLGLTKGAPERFAAEVLAMLASGGRRAFGDKARMPTIGGHVPVVRSHILRINDEYGFIYGAGIPVNFLDLYYEGDRLGKTGASRVLFETVTDELLSLLTLSESRQLLTRPVHGRVHVRSNGASTDMDRTVHTAVMASTVEQLGFGFKGMPLARSEPGKFMLRSTELSFFELGAMVPMLTLGTPVPGVFDAVTDAAVVQWKTPTKTTVDGEMREAHGLDVITCGPELCFLRP